MKLWRTLGISLAVALALLLVGQGSAFALVEELTLDELTAEADSIIVGEVTDITSYQEGEGNIYTLVTLSVEHTIKGESEGEVAIKLPGGEVDGIGLWVADAPIFQLGERTIVFLEEVDSAFEVCGWHQGKFTVQDDRIVETNQSLTSFMADISQAMEAQGITPKLSVKFASMVLESPVESKAVEPEKTEEFLTGWQNIMTDGFEGAFPGTTWYWMAPLPGTGRAIGLTQAHIVSGAPAAAIPLQQTTQIILMLGWSTDRLALLTPLMPNLTSGCGLNQSMAMTMSVVWRPPMEQIFTAICGGETQVGGSLSRLTSPMSTP